MRLRIVPVVAVLLLWGTFFLKLPPLILAGLLITMLGFAVGLVWHLQMDKAGFIVMANYLYWLGSGFLVGAISFNDLATSEFYSGDGRIFLYYIPLLFFSVYVAKRQDLNLIIRISIWMAIGLFILFMVWIYTPYASISKGPSENLVGFTTHHTGMGLLAATLSVLLIVYGRETKRKLLVVLGMLSIIVVIASGSREALVAVAGAIGWYSIRNIKVKVISGVCLAALVLVLSAPYIAPHTYERTAKLFSIEMLTELFKRASTIHWHPGNQKQQSEDPEQDTNMLTRILYWTYAIERFLQSPILGIGWGRFNDPHVRMTGTKGFIYIASQGDRVFSPLQAHNSYLHLLCESGLLGLALMMSLWFSLFFRLRKAALRFAEQPSLRGYYVACQTLVVLILGAALTGHAVGAPTTGIPLFVIIGIGLSYQRHMKGELLPAAAA